MNTMWIIVAALAFFVLITTGLQDEPWLVETFI